MEQHVTAGARVRITFEGIVRHSYQPGDFTLGDGTTVSYLPDRYAAVVLAPGWEVGDIIDTEHGRLTRSVNDGYAHWSRQNDGQMFHDDQVRPEEVTIIHRVTPAPEQAPDPVMDHVARWYAVEALVARAREKGVMQVDTDAIAEALGLDGTDTAPYVSRLLPLRDAVCARPGCGHTGADHHHGDTKCWAHLPRTRDEFGVTSPVTVCQCPGFLATEKATESGDDGFGETPDEYRLSTKADTPTEDVNGQHAFDEEWMSEVAAKRRLPNCSVCKKPATDSAHDGDQSPKTRHLRALLTA